LAHFSLLGSVRKDVCIDELAATFSPSFARKYLTSILKKLKVSTPRLTEKEIEIFKLASTGLITGQIAEQMHLSPKNNYRLPKQD
jgi:DNA-binding NarL/FixJ family response regulator